MLHAPQRLHQILQAEPLIGLNFIERQRGPVHIERADGLRCLVCRRVPPMVRPYVDGGRAGIVVPAALDILLARVAKERLQLLGGIGEVDGVARGEYRVLLLG
jgi:hypothetical protein